MVSRPLTPPTQSTPMPDWLYFSALLLTGIWAIEAALFLLTYRAFGRS
jgi:hypothetical protein